MLKWNKGRLDLEQRIVPDKLFPLEVIFHYFSLSFVFYLFTLQALKKISIQMCNLRKRSAINHHLQYFWIFCCCGGWSFDNCRLRKKIGLVSNTVPLNAPERPGSSKFVHGLIRGFRTWRVNNYIFYSSINFYKIRESC